MRRRRLFLIYLFATVGAGMMLLSAAIGIYKLQGNDNTDFAGEYKLPEFVYSENAPEGAPEAYRGAIRYQDQFSAIPCYCSCGERAGHENLLDCFIAEWSGDQVAFDQHGAG